MPSKNTQARIKMTRPHVKRLCSKCHVGPIKRKGGNLVKQADDIYFHKDESLCVEAVRIRTREEQKAAIKEGKRQSRRVEGSQPYIEVEGTGGSKNRLYVPR